jgi:hypothetical protein
MRLDSAAGSTQLSVARVLKVAPPAMLGRGMLMLVRALALALVSPAAHDG